MEYTGENTTVFTVEDRDGGPLISAQGPEKDGKFFAIRLTDFISCPPERTVKLSFNGSLVSRDGLASTHLALREWIPSGNCEFQVAEPMGRQSRDQSVSAYLTARKAGLVYAGYLIFEAKEAVASVAVKIKNVEIVVI